MTTLVMVVKECLVAAGKVSIELTHDQALVLHEWLARMDTIDQPGIFEDQAEQRVLWDMEAALESALPEILHRDYVQLINAARMRIRDA